MAFSGLSIASFYAISLGGMSTDRLVGCDIRLQADAWLIQYEAVMVAWTNLKSLHLNNRKYGLPKTDLRPFKPNTEE